MDAETQAKLIKGMHRELGVAYSIVRHVLAGLPVPMYLPWDAAADPQLAILSVIRAWELVQPGLSEIPADDVRDMTIAWLTAHHLAVAALERGLAPWQAAAFDAQIASLKTSARRIRRWMRRNGYLPKK